MKRTLGGLILLSLMVPLEVQAQETLLVRPGDRVRVTALDCSLRRITGEFQAVAKDSLHLVIRGEDLRCPVTAVTRLELFQGRRSWWGPALIGAGLTAGVGVTMCSDAEDPDLCSYVAVLGGIPLGFILGGFIGSIWGRDRWEDIPFPPVLRAVLVSADDRFRVGFSLSLRE